MMQLRWHAGWRAKKQYSQESLRIDHLGGAPGCRASGESGEIDRVVIADSASDIYRILSMPTFLILTTRISSKLWRRVVRRLA